MTRKLIKVMVSTAAVFDDGTTEKLMAVIIKGDTLTIIPTDDNAGMTLTPDQNKLYGRTEE